MFKSSDIRQDWRGRVIIKNLDAYHKLLLQVKRAGQAQGYTKAVREQSKRSKSGEVQPRKKRS